MKKLSLKDLKVKSFITNLSEKQVNTVFGGHRKTDVIGGGYVAPGPAENYQPLDTRFGNCDVTFSPC